MTVLSLPTATDAAFTDRLFGGNILASRDELGKGTGFEELVRDLNVTSLRYPGGSLTEDFFDISAPDRELVGEDGTQKFIPISQFMDYVDDNDLSAVIVLPTRFELSRKEDANGDRFADVDEAELRQFISDVVNGVYGDAKIDAFEIGNEYWGSGRMSAVEYGRVSSEVARIVDDELNNLARTNPVAKDIDIVVQHGTNLNYSKLADNYDHLTDPNDILDALNEDYGNIFDESIILQSGNIKWNTISNKLILREFDLEEELEAIDAMAIHVYSKSHDEASRDFHLEVSNSVWQEELDEYEIYVTEWNQSGNDPGFDDDTDYGLHQAHEMLNTLEAMVFQGVDQAQVWPLIQNTPNALTPGFSYDQLTPGGQMFKLMSESLPGKTVLDLDAGSEQTEQVDGNSAVHAFYGNGELTLFIASTGTKGMLVSDLDLSALVNDVGTASIRVLGVADGDDIGGSRSEGVIEEIDPDVVLEDNWLSVTLGPGEIMQVVLNGFEPSEAFETTMEQIDARQDGAGGGADGDGVAVVPMALPNEVAGVLPTGGFSVTNASAPVPPFVDMRDEDLDEDTLSEETDASSGSDVDGGDGGMGLGVLALILPCLALLGM